MISHAAQQSAVDGHMHTYALLDRGTIGRILMPKFRHRAFSAIDALAIRLCRREGRISLSAQKAWTYIRFSSAMTAEDKPQRARGYMGFVGTHAVLVRRYSGISSAACSVQRGSALPGLSVSAVELVTATMEDSHMSRQKAWVLLRFTFDCTEGR